MLHAYTKPKPMLIFLLLSIVVQAHCNLFICSNETITRSGLFPLEDVDTPANYNCIMNFQIPVNFILRFTLFPGASGAQTRNTAYVIDAQNKTRYFTETYSVIFSTAPSCQLHIHTKQQTELFIKYEFDNFRDKTQIMADVGTAYELNFPHYNFLTFKAPITKEKLTLTVGSLPREDNIASNVYVYGSKDLATASIATLDNYNPTDDKWINTDHISLVRFDRSKDYSGVYVIANSKNIIEKYSNYTLLVSTWSRPLYTFSDFTDNNTAITVVSHEFPFNYIDDLDFLKGNGSVEFYPFGPGHPDFQKLKAPILTYQNSTYIRQRKMCQQIPISTFTMVVKKAEIKVRIGQCSQGWSTFDSRSIGKRLVIYSPSLWNHTDTAAFEYQFRVSLGRSFGFSISVASMQITKRMEMFKSEIGLLWKEPMVSVVRCKYDLPMCSENFEGGTAEAYANQIRVSFNGTSWPTYVVAFIDVF